MATPVLFLGMLVAGGLRAPAGVVASLGGLAGLAWLSGMVTIIVSTLRFNRTLTRERRQRAAMQGPQRQAELERQLAAERAEFRRGPKQFGATVLGAFCFALAGISLGVTLNDWPINPIGVAVTAVFLALCLWCWSYVVRSVRAQHRYHQAQAEPLVEAVEQHARLTPDTRRLTILRIGPVRWIIAELLPFATMALFLVPAWAWHPLQFLVLAGVFLSSPPTAVYLNMMHGAGPGWIVVLVILQVPCFLAGAGMLGIGTTGDSGKIVVTQTAAIVAAVIAAVLAVAVALAVATGERWVRKNRAGLAPNRQVAHLLPYGGRGMWARLWAPLVTDIEGSGTTRVDGDIHGA